MVAPAARNRRAGELLAQGAPAAEIGHAIGQASEGVDTVPLLASAARATRSSPTPALDGLAALVRGRIDPEQWTATVTEPASPTSPLGRGLCRPRPHRAEVRSA